MPLHHHYARLCHKFLVGYCGLSIQELTELRLFIGNIHMIQSIQLDNYKLTYTTAGQPDALLLLLLMMMMMMMHGWLSYRGVWRQTIEALQDDYYCVAVDLLGFGGSDKPAEADYGLAIHHLDLRPHLAKIAASTLTIFGRQDAVVPISDGYLVKEHIPNSQFVLIDACGHFPMYEQTQPYLVVLQEFLMA
jgi:pimeloyl-ACP methyl ester carboxylesterase